MSNLKLWSVIAIALLCTGLAYWLRPVLAQPPAISQTVQSGLQTRPDFPPIGVSYEKETPRQGQAQAAGACSKYIDPTGQLRGVTHVAVQENGICYNADIDTFTHAGRSYVVQGGGYDAAFTITDVSDPANPAPVHQSIWDRAYTYTPDVKAFAQNGVPYIAISMERYSASAYCGVAIYDVSNPAQPALRSHSDGTDWCDVHNLFVEDDGNGEGAYIYITANAPHDMRVLDISGAHGGSVSAPQEIGRYTLPGSTYIHDITVVDHSAYSGGSIGRRVYISYWERGLVVLNAADVTPGTDPTPVVAADRVDPAGFRTHHAMPSPDGARVFIQDEFLYGTGNEPVQMWDISNPAAPAYVDGLRLGTDAPENTAHNLEIRPDIDPDRLFVGWYKLGLQAWDFTSSGFVRNHAAPRTAALYHQVQTGSTDSIYSGAWGVRLARINGALYVFQSDYRYGLVIDCILCPDQITPTVTSTGTGTATNTPADTATMVPTFTPTVTPVITPTVTPTATGVLNATPTPQPPHGITVTLTPEASPTLTGTVIPAPTVLPTATPTATVPMTLTASQVYTVALDADANGMLSPGDELTVTVTVRNGTEETLTDVAFSESMGRYLYALTESVTTTHGTMTPPGTTLLPGIDLSLGTLAPGETATIRFRVLLRETIPPWLRFFAIQGTVTAAGVDPVRTDDPATAPMGDATEIRLGGTHALFVPIVEKVE